jgi:hypothetical protein
VTSPESIANGVRVQRDVTVALKMKSIRVTSLDSIANGVRVQRGKGSKGRNCCIKKKELIRVTSPDSITNGVRIQRDVTVALKKGDKSDLP